MKTRDSSRGVMHTFARQRFAATPGASLSIKVTWSSCCSIRLASDTTRTSFDVRVHDIPKDDQWTLFQFVYTQDKLEQVFDVVNEVDGSKGDHSVKLALLGTVARMDDVDANSVCFPSLRSITEQGLITHASP